MVAVGDRLLRDQWIVKTIVLAKQVSTVYPIFGTGKVSEYLTVWDIDIQPAKPIEFILGFAPVGASAIEVPCYRGYASMCKSAIHGPFHEMRDDYDLFIRRVDDEAADVQVSINLKFMYREGAIVT
jgi:hypothetical protein